MMMNHRYFVEEEWAKLLDELSDYTFCECVLAVMSCGKIKNREDLQKVTDAQMIEIIKKTVEKEKE